MSWIIQTLLINKNDIKRSVHSRQENLLTATVYTNSQLRNIDFIDAEEQASGIENDSYYDLLLVESAVKDLEKAGVLSDDDIKTVNFVSQDSMESPKVAKRWINRRFADVCNRIAYYMGGYFTDDGYLIHIRDKYRLSEEQLDILSYYIKSNYKHKIIRKPLKNDRHYNSKL